MTRAELRQRIYNYVMADTHRLEVFVDYEICKGGDYDKYVEEVVKLLDDMSTYDMTVIVDNIEHEDEFEDYYGIFYSTRDANYKKKVADLSNKINEITEKYEALEQKCAELEKTIVWFSKSVPSQYM